MKKILLMFALMAVALGSASAQKVRVMSYNVKNGMGVDGITSIDRCSDVIRKVNPDVVAIQEVDSVNRRNNYYVLGRMAEQTGYHAYYGPTIKYRGGKYGIGVLSKQPALSTKFYPMPHPREDRGVLVVEFKKYYLVCTHLSGQYIKNGRCVQVDVIREAVSDLKKPVFIAGDMNARPGTPVMNAFKEFATVLSDENKKTAPSYDPRGCIDYVLGTNGSFKVLGEEVIYGCFASDHLPLYVDVKVSKAKKRKNTK
jgi:endonuclease/exonuclease/phosphatase family metal-dependent hydrolase